MQNDAQSLLEWWNVLGHCDRFFLRLFAWISGTTCEVDACETHPCARGACKRTAAGRACNCDADWQGEACDENTNPQLRDIALSTGKLFPPFHPRTFEYEVDIGISSPMVTLFPLAQVTDGVQIIYDGVPAAPASEGFAVPVNLNAVRKVEIEVRADSGAAQSYIVKLRRTFVEQTVLLGTRRRGELGRLVALHGDSIIATEGRSVSDRTLQSRVQLYNRTAGKWSIGMFPTLEGLSSTARFGSALAMSENWVVVGASEENTGPGSVYAIHRSKLLLPRLHPEEVARLTRPSGKINEGFGEMGIAIHQSTIVAGARLEEGLTGPMEGAAYVFRFDGTGWASPLRLAAPSDERFFGTSMAIEMNRLAVGSPGESGGFVALYDLDDLGHPLTTLRDERAAFLGTNIAVHRERVAAASVFACIWGPCIGNTDVFVFSRTNQGWTSERFGLPPPAATAAPFVPVGFGAAGIAVIGDAIFLTSPFEGSDAPGINAPELVSTSEYIYNVGAAHMFENHGEGWKVGAYIKASAPAEGDEFGASFAAFGDTVVFSAPGRDAPTDDPHDDSGENVGALYVFGIDCAQVPKGAYVPGC